MKLYDIQEPSDDKSSDFKTQINEGRVIGIDLGTTNSLVGASQDGKVEIIKNPISGDYFTPSIVAYKGSETVVGEQALKLDDKIISVKRLMKHANQQTKLGRTPVEVSADILAELKSQAEKYLNCEVSSAVITVPAYFDETARQATKDAAKIAGLEVLRLINEPTAAAVAYGLDTKEEGIFAIYDLGGGTFDVSILRMTQGVFQVVATGGDSNLGGDDFDLAIYNELINDSIPETDKQNTLLEARKIKEHLSSNDEWSGKIHGKTTSLTRKRFEEIVAPLLEKTIQHFQDCLKSAELSPDDIKEIILVGGATRVPAVKSAIESKYNKKPLDTIDPDQIVAHGAALQSEALHRGSNSLLLDVIPLSLGIEVADKLVETIIPRNTPIPVARNQKFTTGVDNQTGFVIHVLQGEGEKVDECRSLAKFELKNVPALPAGQAKLEINFQIDADGLLSVSATELSQNIKQAIEVKPSYGLTEEEVIKLIRIARDKTA